MIKFQNNFKANKKPAFEADSLESRNGSLLSSSLTFLSIAKLKIISKQGSKPFQAYGVSVRLIIKNYEI